MTLSRLAKCHGFGGLIRVNFLEVWGKYFESVIRVLRLGNLTPCTPTTIKLYPTLQSNKMSQKRQIYLCKSFGGLG